ncbi:hypothetical protein HMPREF1550_00414 [Actinomyces sp. oral taxon 877 str. F0543]|nr:hypothetical protein HMPREF1550_00414 [Actinomyces sp. oral taxon 877 str. F0543]
MIQRPCARTRAHRGTGPGGAHPGAGAGAGCPLQWARGRTVRAAGERSGTGAVGAAPGARYDRNESK